MKPKKIIFSSDENHDYYNFWKLNSKYCKEILNITPVLFYITDNDSDFYEDEYGIVKNVKRHENIPTSFQSQIVRLFGTQFFEDDVCVISDIDMFLINESYIEFDDNNYDLLITDSDAYDLNRPEVRSYIPNLLTRYPMCYIVGKGSTFKKILNLESNFRFYCDYLFNLTYQDKWSTDEFYFARMLHENGRELKVKMNVRGYMTDFYVNDRIHKSNFFENQIFKLNVNEHINFNKFIDIHFPKFTENELLIHKTVNNLTKFKKKQKDNMEIYLIACHITNDTQLKYLKNLTDDLSVKGKKFVLSSHTMLTSDIINKSIGFIYDSVNPTYKRWEFDSMPYYSYYTDGFELHSQYISYGGTDFYHVGAIRLLINGIKYIQSLPNIKVIHWIEYDAIPLYEEESLNSERLKTHDFIFYGIGSRFSFNKERVSQKFLNLSDEQILKNLEKYDWVAEKLIGELLIEGKKIFIDVSEKRYFWGKYDQHLSNHFNWCLFENNNNVNLFIKNLKNEQYTINVGVNKIFFDMNIFPNSWHLIDLSTIEKFQNFQLIKDKNILIDLDFNDKILYNNVVKKVKFLPK